MTLQVLVVDDVPAMAEQYAYDLKRVGGYQVMVAGGGDYRVVPADAFQIVGVLLGHRRHVVDHQNLQRHVRSGPRLSGVEGPGLSDVEGL